MEKKYFTNNYEKVILKKIMELYYQEDPRSIKRIEIVDMYIKILKILALIGITEESDYFLTIIKT